MTDTQSLDQQLLIRETPLGRGVFAETHFLTGEVIDAVTGRIIGPDDTNYDDSYCIDLDGELMFDPEPPFRFLNHNCEPNCEVFSWEGDPRLWVQCRRPIQVGEELTIDYAWPIEHAIPCRCDSAKCRGWIIAPDQLHLLAAEPPPTRPQATVDTPLVTVK